MDKQKGKYGLCCCVLQKTLRAHMIRAISVFIVCTAVWVVGCVSSQPIAPNPIGKGLLGKSKQELVSCAGTPLQEAKTVDGTILAYYKEAPMFEESFSLSKGSTTGIHHGCWAHILTEEDRVVGVEYRSVPRSVDATDHCEEMFRTCVP